MVGGTGMGQKILALFGMLALPSHPEKKQRSHIERETAKAFTEGGSGWLWLVYGIDRGSSADGNGMRARTSSDCPD